MEKIVTMMFFLILTGCQSVYLPLAANEYQSTYSSLPEKKLSNPVKINGTVFHVSEIESNIMSEIEYHSYSEKKAALELRAKNEMWKQSSLDERIEELNNFYKYGYFVVIGYDYTIDSASNGYLKVILIQNGKPIRTNLMNGIASVPTNYGYGRDMWWNLTRLSLSDLDTKSPFEIRVVSTLTSNISRYKYTPTIVQ